MLFHGHFFFGFEAFSKFAGGNSNYLCKYPAIVVGIIKTGINGNLCDGIARINQIIFAAFYAYFINIGIDIDTGALFEYMAQIRDAAMAKLCKLLDGNVLQTVLTDIFKGVRKDCIFVGIMVAIGSCCFWMGLFQNFIRMAQVFCK